MRLAKLQIDIGLFTNQLQPMLRFWRNEAGLTFDHRLNIRPGRDQYRHLAQGSVVKVNHQAVTLPCPSLNGYRELVIARDDLAVSRSLADPDGNRVSLVPRGQNGVSQVAVRVAVSDLDAHRRFYAEGLGLSEETPGVGVYRAGDSLLILESSAATAFDGVADVAGKGWRYITFQVFEVDREHAHILACGGREGLAPVTLGETARISMVRDPDGNWIELSQRASIVGSLEPSR